MNESALGLGRTHLEVLICYTACTPSSRHTSSKMEEKFILSYKERVREETNNVSQCEILIQKLGENSEKDSRMSITWLDYLAELPPLGSSWWKNEKQRSVLKEVLQSSVKELPFDYNRSTVPEGCSSPILPQLLEWSKESNNNYSFWPITNMLSSLQEHKGDCFQYVHDFCSQYLREHQTCLAVCKYTLNQLAEDLGKRQCAQAIILENKWTKWEDIFPCLEFNNPFPLFSNPELNESLNKLSSTLPLRTVYNLAKDENEQNLFKAAPLLGSNMDGR
jgi:hypothetical protein